MKFSPTLLTALLLTPIVALHAADVQQPTAKPWVTLGDDGNLRYQNTSNGDRIVDFSHAGYGGGGNKLPIVPVRKEVAPSGGEDSAAIQAAIDAVAALPLTAGFRGAVLLKPGTFHCSKPLTVSKEGTVLRGSGADKDGTVIEMTGAPHTAVNIAGERLSFPKENPASVFAIADAYVPSGALSLSVKDAKGLATGDAIRIRWLRTAKWIHFMGMDALVRDGKPQTWMKSDSPIAFERKIRSIEGNRITLDVPLTDAIDERFLAPGTAVAVRTAEPKRLPRCGLESLRIDSPPPSGTLAAANNTAVELDNCEDCWVKNVEMHDTLNIVRVLGGARRITIESVHAAHTGSVAKGAGYPSDFTLVGSQVLIDRCSSSGDGAFYVATLNSGATLNVALNCSFQGNGGIQPHMHWSTGLLIDSCQLPGGRIEFINRGTSGSGHGWAIGWAVTWNCTAKLFNVQQPPGAVNWCIGCLGGQKNGPAPNSPWLSSHGTPVIPRSLYLAQLRERLGESAVKNIGYAEENGKPVAPDAAAIRAQVFQCKALGRHVSYSAFTPIGTPPEGGWPLVLLLHGAGRNHRTIAEDAVCRAVVLRQKFAIVFADGKLGWYLDSPADPKSRYQSMLRELLAHARRTLPVSPKPERTGICGWSMGGYGAMRFAETFPGEIAAVATSIALLDFPNPRLPRAQNYPVSPLFGADESAWPKFNCMTDVASLRGKPLLFVTAKDAFDAQMNRNFHARLEAAGIAHTFLEVDGAHVFRTVQETLPALLEFLGNKLASPASR